MAHERWLNENQQRLWRLYVDVQHHLERVLHRELLADSGLSSAEFAVLVPLSETLAEKLRARDLCRELGWDRTRLSHLVTRMQQRGLVRRSACAGDARGSMVELTDEGRRAITDAAPAHTEAVRRYLIDLLDDDEIATMTDIFQRVLEGLDPQPD
jgi:DNA-binding MarR family transcriptional regulator